MKNTLRSQKLLERLQHHPNEKQAKDKRVIDILSTLPQFQQAKNILFYLSIHGEVDLIELFQRFKDSKTFVLPRVESKTLRLHQIQDLEETEPGSYKILEPKKHLPILEPNNIDLALIPGVVFGKNGHRIGYGQGHFDRLLKTSKCVRVGIAYNFQIVDNIAGEAHDVPMDLIVTEERILHPQLPATSYQLPFP